MWENLCTVYLFYFLFVEISRRITIKSDDFNLRGSNFLSFQRQSIHWRKTFNRSRAYVGQNSLVIYFLYYLKRDSNGPYDCLLCKATRRKCGFDSHFTPIVAQIFCRGTQYPEDSLLLRTWLTLFQNFVHCILSIVQSFLAIIVQDIHKTLSQVLCQFCCRFITSQLFLCSELVAVIVLLISSSGLTV